MKLGDSCNEVESRAAMHGERFAGKVRNHEDWTVKWGIIAPPAIPHELRPGPRSTSKHVSAHYYRANIGHSFPQDIVAGPCVASFLTEHFFGRAKPKHPIVEVLCTFAERHFERMIQSGREAVK